jgi:hypothetical protein
MNTAFASAVTGTAFALTLSRNAINFLQYYVTGDRKIVEDFRYPGWQALERRGLILTHRDATGCSQGNEVTEAGYLVFRLCQEAGLIPKSAVPMQELQRKYAA